MKDIESILNGTDPTEVFNELKKVKLNSTKDKIDLLKGLAITWEFFAKKHLEGKLFYRPTDPEDVKSVTSSVEVFPRGNEVNIQFIAKMLEHTFSIGLSKDEVLKFNIRAFLRENLKLSEFIDDHEKYKVLDKSDDSRILIHFNKNEKTISIQAMDEKNKSDSKIVDQNPGVVKIIEQRNEIKSALTKGNDYTKYSFPKTALELLNNDINHLRLKAPNFHANNLITKISNKIEGIEVPRKNYVREKGISM